MGLFKKKPKYYSYDSYLQKLEYIQMIHMTDFGPDDTKHRYMIRALKQIKRLIYLSDPDYIEAEHIILITFCLASSLHYFIFDIDPRELCIKVPKRKNLIADCVCKIYEDFAKKYLEFSNDICQVVVQYITDTNLWATELFAMGLLKTLLVHTEAHSDLLVFILAEVESRDDEIEIRSILRVLYRLLENYKWSEGGLDWISRLLHIFYLSVKGPKLQDNYKYVPCRKALDFCLKMVVRNVGNKYIMKIVDVVVDWILEEEDDISGNYDFGIILQFASQQHKVGLYRDSLDEKLIRNIFRLIKSPFSVCSLLGHQILQNFLDRHDNINFFRSPRLFYQRKTYEITVPPESFSDDRHSVQTYRALIHDSILACVRNHGMYRGMVETVYTTLCMLSVEIKCGHVCAAVCCILMDIQDIVLSKSYSESLECAHRIHALIVSVLSLNCWLHDMDVFYNYLNKVCSERAIYAPFLNTPLKNTYKYSDSDILWYKKELFFEDWKIRFCLWVFFRNVKWGEFDSSYKNKKGSPKLSTKVTPISEDIGPKPDGGKKSFATQEEKEKKIKKILSSTNIRDDQKGQDDKDISY